MSQPKDTDSLPAEELLLVDLLYGELDGEAHAAARAQLDGDPALSSELSELRGLRALMAELPDEEPAPALSAQLLHAAAKQAPSSRGARVAAAAEGAGFLAWLKQFFRPMAMHPAMAAAATFVLVVGVAGALYVSGRVEVSEPRAPSGATLADERAPAEASAVPESPARTKIAAPASRFDDDVVPDEEAAGDMPAGGSGRGVAEDRAATAQTGDTTTAKPPEARKRATRKPAAKPDSTGFGGRDDVVSAWSQEGGEARPPAAPPPEKGAKKKRASGKKSAGEETDAVLQGTSGDGVLGVGAVADKKKSETAEDAASREREERLAQARLLHKRAQDAARDGECDAVIDVGNRIRKLDSRYYDTVYLRDKSLYACRRVNAPNAE